MEKTGTQNVEGVTLLSYATTSGMDYGRGNRGGAMPPEDISERAFVFACRVLLLCDPLIRRRGIAGKVGNQLADAASSLGANLQEADGAQSKADFISKSSIALKEARESWHWLRVMEATIRPLPSEAPPLRREANELVAILTTIVKNAKLRPPTR